jgi:hypothetical protein
MSGKFKELSAVGVRIIIKDGDVLLREEPNFSETWQKETGYGLSNVEPGSEGYQYKITPSSRA